LKTIERLSGNHVGCSAFSSHGVSRRDEPTVGGHDVNRLLLLAVVRDSQAHEGDPSAVGRVPWLDVESRLGHWERACACAVVAHRPEIRRSTACAARAGTPNSPEADKGPVAFTSARIWRLPALLLSASAEYPGLAPVWPQSAPHGAGTFCRPSP
jgi:hypothetical protein